MPKIMLTPSFLREKAQSLTSSQDTLNTTMTNIKELANSLPGEWEGQAQAAFLSSYETKVQVYKTFSNDLQKFADFLKDYAGTMDNADAGGASAAEGLQS